jgi:hypothetical protein
MMSPGMMSAPALPTYPAPAYVPRQPPPRQVAPAQPKPLVRAQAPEEPKPARPPLLTLPSPEQLGVAVRPVENPTDWAALHARMKELGVLSFHMDSLPDGSARFTCWMPGDRPGLSRRIESVAATEVEAVQRGLQAANHADKRIQN